MAQVPRALVARTVILVLGGLFMGLVLVLSGGTLGGVVVALSALIGPPGALVLTRKYGGWDGSGPTAARGAQTGGRGQSSAVVEHRGHPRRYTLALSNWLMAGTFVVLGLFFVFTANDSSQGVDRPQLLWVAIGIVGAVGSLTLAVRAWRAGAFVVNDVLIVRNLFRTYRLQRAAISGFATVPAKALGYPRTVVTRTVGDAVVITTLGGRPAHPVLARAFAELEAWRTQGPSVPPDTNS